MFRFLVKFLMLAGMILLTDRIAAFYLKDGLDKYFGLNREAEVLCIGHSHTVLGINASQLEQRLGVPVAKYAIAGAETMSRMAMLQQYFSEHTNSVNLVIYDVDANTFNSKAISFNAYKLFYPYMDNSEIDRYVRDNSGSWSEYATRRSLKLLRYNSPTAQKTPSLRNMAIGGHVAKEKYYTDRLDITRVQKDIHNGKKVTFNIDDESVRAFEETIKFVRARNVKIALVYIPTIDLLHDLDRRNYERIIGMFQQYADKDPGVMFLNFNPEYDHRYELFFDPTHLNRKGQLLVTDDLAGMLASFRLRAI